MVHDTAQADAAAQFAGDIDTAAIIRVRSSIELTYSSEGAVYLVRRIRSLAL